MILFIKPAQVQIRVIRLNLSVNSQFDIKGLGTWELVECVIEDELLFITSCNVHYLKLCTINCPFLQSLISHPNIVNFDKSLSQTGQDKQHSEH